MSQEITNIKPRKKLCCGCLREYDETVEQCPVDRGFLTPLYFDNPEFGQSLGASLKVKDMIGEGRVARILLCEQESTGKQFVLRLLKRLEQRYVNAFHQEGQLLSRLDHPRIVKLQAAGTLGQQPYMMLEYLPGGNLGQWLSKAGSISFAETCRIVSQVSEALLYLSGKDVAYPILKPEHIMYRDPQKSDLCLIDVSQTFYAHDNRNISIGGAIFLNPHFSAPEVLMGRAPTIDSSAYSISCLVYRCLIGQNLFGGQTDLQLASKHMSAKPPQVNWSDFGVPADFAAVIEKGFAKSAAERSRVEDFAAMSAKYAR